MENKEAEPKPTKVTKLPYAGPEEMVDNAISMTFDNLPPERLQAARKQRALELSIDKHPLPINKDLSSKSS